MPSPLKRPSLARLLASLRSSRAGAPPVQTGFPTSLADIVVRHHGRLRKPRKSRRPAAAVIPSTSPYPVEVAEEELTPPPPTPQSLAPVGAQRRSDFRLLPELLAVGGAVALALLAVWGEGTVAAFIVAAMFLLCIESASRRLPTKTMALLDSCGRGPVSPIGEAVQAPRSSSSDSDEGSEASTPRTAADEPTTPTRKGKKSLRKMISMKLQKKPASRDSSSSPEHPSPVLRTESSVTPSSVSASESSTEWSSCSSSSSESVAVVVHRRGHGVKFPLSAFVPVILTGLAVGKLPATALAVLCVAFFSAAVQRV